MNRGKFMIIDGHSLAHRAFHALPLLSTTGGEFTNAAYGFTTMLLRLMGEEKPDLVAVTFDKGAPTFRHAEFAAYKATRKKMPDEFRSQIPLIKEIVCGFDISVFEVEGYEADDVIGTLSRRAEEEGYDVTIVTGDRDALQLVSPHTKTVLMRKGITEMETYDEKGVQDHYGLAPAQLVDLKALMGDPSDNIPGVPGIGEKTALKLIQEFGSLERLLSDLNRVENRRQRELIQSGVSNAHLSKRLATIVRDVPVEVDFERCKLRRPDATGLRNLFQRLEFRSLIKRLAAPGILEGQGSQEGHREASLGVSCEGGMEIAKDLAAPRGQEGGEARNSPKIVPKIVTDEKELAGLADKLSKADVIAFDAVFDDNDPMRAGLVGVGFGLAGHSAYYVPCVSHGPRHDQCCDPLGILKPVFEDSSIGKVCHDAKPKIIAMSRHGVRLAGLAFDTTIASYLLDPTLGNHQFEGVVRRYLGRELPVPPHAPGRAGRAGRGTTSRALTGVEPEVIGGYLCEILPLFFELEPLLRAGLAARGLLRLFEEIELPLVGVLARMEMNGVAVDLNALREISGELKERIAGLADEIYRLAGTPFNINSPKQLATILFDKLGLPAVKSTKTGRSTDAQVLDELEGTHEIVAKILDYRQLVKLKTTYVDALPGLIHPETGRIHTTFNQTVTATGRLSSADPNLQNIPVRTEEGRRIRRMFVPGENGHVIMSADYSQIELRVLAHISRDPDLLDGFRNDQDIHTRTASEVFGVPMEKVTPAMRETAKRVNFGIVYGISDFGLARGLHLSRRDAKRYMDIYFEHYSGVKRYVTEIVKKAREDGYVTTLLNRRRYLPELYSTRVADRKFAERTAMNTPIQGTAADIIKLAMVETDRKLKELELESKMILQVHDELVFEVPEDEIPAVSELVKETMENAMPLDVPLKVDVKWGNSWMDAK